MCGGGKEIRNSRLESCNPRKSRDKYSPASVSPVCVADLLPANKSVPREFLQPATTATRLPSLVDRGPPAIAHMMYPSLRPFRTAEMSDGEKAVRATRCCSRYALRRPDHLRKRRGTAPLSGVFSFYINNLDICGGGKATRIQPSLQHNLWITISPRRVRYPSGRAKFLRRLGQAEYYVARRT